jgi:hypothetical protein
MPNVANAVIIAKQITRTSAILLSSLIVAKANRHAGKLRALSAREEQNPDCWLFQVLLRNDCVRLIRKLRWIGMDDEAERVLAQLSGWPFRPTETVIAGPWATD